MSWSRLYMLVHVNFPDVWLKRDGFFIEDDLNLVYVTVIHFILKGWIIFSTVYNSLFWLTGTTVYWNSLKHLDGRKSLYKASSKRIQSALQGIIFFLFCSHPWFVCHWYHSAHSIFIFFYQMWFLCSMLVFMVFGLG